MNDETYTVGIRVTLDKGNTDGDIDKTKQGFTLMDGVIMELGRKLVNLATETAKFAAQWALKIGKEAVVAASNLEEQTNKFNVVFRGVTAEAEQFAAILVESYLMSTREAKQYLASVQDLLKPMGMATDAAADMAFGVVKLAADLGSFNNMPTVEVMQAIQSALVGEYEPMRRFGVVINETRLKQEALNMGFTVGTGVMDPLVKAQAAYSLMLKGSADAIGDVDRSSTSYANTVKALLARWEDIQATLGNALLPLLSELGQELLRFLSEYGPSIDQAAAWIGESFAIVVDYVEHIANFFVENDWGSIFGVVTFALLDMSTWFAGILGQMVVSVLDWAADTLDTFITFIGNGQKGTGTLSILWRAAWDYLYITIKNTFIDIYNAVAVPLQDMINIAIIPVLNTIGKSFDETLNAITQIVNKASFLFPQDWVDGLNRMNTATDFHLEAINITAKGRMNELTDDQKAALNIIGGIWDQYNALRATNQAAADAYLETEIKEHHAEIINVSKQTTETLGTPGTGASGADAAEAWGSGWENTFESSVLPAFEQNMQTMEETATATANAIMETMSGLSTWSDGGTYQAGINLGGNSYQYNNTTGEWGQYVGGNWNPAGEDAMAAIIAWLAAHGYGSGGGYESGGELDVMRSLLPSFARGGEIPFFGTPGEIVLPRADSGRTFQGMAADNGRVVGGGMTLNFYGFLINGDSVREAVKTLEGPMANMYVRDELPKLRNAIRGK